MTSHRRSIYNRQLLQQHFEAYFRFPWSPLEINKLPQLSHVSKTESSAQEEDPTAMSKYIYTKLYFRKENICFCDL